MVTLFSVTSALAMMTGILFSTRTVMFLLTAGAYSSLPAKLTVIMAVPSVKPLIIPFSTTATVVLLEV